MRRPYVFLVCFLLLITLLVSACRKDDPKYIAERDRKRILEYLNEHELDYVELDSGVFIVTYEEGSGGYPSENSTVRMNYEGYLLDGTVFDSRQNAYINISNTVRGFQIGVQEFQRGGKGTIFIPSALGYGEFPPHGVIPRHAVLIFDIEIIDF